MINNGVIATSSGNQDFIQLDEKFRREPLGNGFDRLYFNKLNQYECSMIAKIFIETIKYLKSIESMPHINEMQIKGELYDAKSLLVLSKYVDYLDVLIRIEEKLSRSDELTICIEGDCCAGKTYLANCLQELYGGNVFHLDDFYRPLDERMPNWKRLVAGNMNLERFESSILIPLQQKCTVLYNAYSCQDKMILPPLRLSYTPINIVEGSYAMHGGLDTYYDLKIYLEVDEDKQLERIQKRNAAALETFKDLWIPLEKRYHDVDRVKDMCDVVINTTNLF